MPTIITRGAMTARGYGFGASAATANYIEDVFSTYLYTGNGYISPNLTQSINNSIDLSTYGGMVWIKCRSTAYNNAIFDTSRGSPQKLVSNSTASQFNDTGSLTSFNSNGFSLGSDSGTSTVNAGGQTYASWTFRKQAKFFDVVTYTGTGANRTVAHNLGSVPGCIIVKATSTTGSWITYHRSLGNTDFVNLNTTAATSADSGAWNNTTPTSTDFSLGTGNTNVNGVSYVAYLFAHNAGGFGAAGTDNVISCGSFTTDASGNYSDITLGWEPQWVLFKSASSATNWFIYDIMRGMSQTSGSQLNPNSSGTEGTTAIFKPTSTGLSAYQALSANTTYIYIAIRRGPMKTPTSGTSVYNAITRTGTGSAATVTGIGFPPDMVMSDLRSGPNGYTFNRLAGFTNTNVRYLLTPLGYSESSGDTTTSGFLLDGTTTGTISITTGSANQNVSGSSYIEYFMRRAPGFFDVVCYNGNGTNRTINHNLGVTPELIIVKGRLLSGPWSVYSAALANTEYLLLNTTAAKATNATLWNSTSPTASVFSLGTSNDVNNNYASGSATYVAYLFATVAGVSKVGSYTGSGTTKQIDCGFTGGARFVLIKRTDSTGDWYVWDSARGIVAGNDPYLLLNSTAAEVTNTDYVDTYSAGFEISSTAPAAINASGGSFIFLAIA